MNLTSKEIIKNLNERLLMQAVVVETLCDLLVENGVVTHEDLEDMIKENLESQQEKIRELRQNSQIPIKVKVKTPISNMFAEEEEELFGGLYFGPVGEA